MISPSAPPAFIFFGKQLILVTYGDPGKIRTSDLRFRKPSLYPSELQGHAVLVYSTGVLGEQARRPGAAIGFPICRFAHSASNVEFEEEDVAVFDDVLLAFGAQQAFFFDGLFAAEGEESSEE